MTELKLVSKSHICSNIWTFNFKPRITDYLPGQFIELINPRITEAQNSKRWFTLSSSPTEKLLSITTRIDPENQESEFKNSIHTASPGELFYSSAPMGDFVLIKDTTRPIIFIAAGIGITPFRSILKYLTDSKQKRSILLISIVVNSSDQAFNNELKNFDCKYQQIETKNKQLDLNRIYQAIAGDLKNNPVVYISGPESLVEKIKNKLLSNNIVETDLITDYFPGY